MHLTKGDKGDLPLSERVQALHREVLATQPAVCAERAVLVTRYFKRLADQQAPVIVRKAAALAHVLRHKRVRIYPRELLVGGFTGHRVGGGLFPELHGVPMLEDLWRFHRRPTNPMTVSRRERRQLLTEVLPYWLPRFMALRIRPRRQALRFIVDQLSPSRYLINETGGISHFVPDYQSLLTRGTEGFREQAERRLAEVEPGSPEAAFLRAVAIVCDGLDAFAEGYRRQAERLSRTAPDDERRRELEAIAAVCARVPRYPARGLHEALQSILFAQIALNLESLDNAVSPGRLDQILWTCFENDLAAGRIDRAGAFELLGCYAVKLCEIVPVFSRRLTRFHGGMFNGQVVVVGGTGRDGEDATNELSRLLVELMDRLRTRQPNYHARLHAGSPADFRARIASALASGAVSPALYNDRAIVPLLRGRGATVEDARDYATVGCVEPVVAGKSFFSTDAALFNLPLCLELALNRGRRFGRRRRLGVATPPAERCGSVEDLIALFAEQLRAAVARLIADLRRVEEVNARVHPTPLTSTLIEGCMDSLRDASAGGARYNGSGIQGVGVVEVGDSLAAIDAVILRGAHASMARLVGACRRDFAGASALRARLKNAPRYGDDDPAADRFTGRVMELFAGCFEGELNSRGGAYVPGYYSVTAHAAFGEVVGALPSGRKAGAPFSSGISPASGHQRSGPTAALLSSAGLPLHLAPNGVNFNLELAPWAVAGEAGRRTLSGLIDGGMAAGCMQMQVNVLDPAVLVEARDHPGRYPGLLVRVSGYSAYFDDLTPEVKQEIIDRTHYSAVGPP